MLNKDDQDQVIGGYTRGTTTFDALIFGYYDGDDLIYVARTRNGFTPAARTQLFRKFKSLEIDDCPFVNLPNAKTGRWNEGVTVEDMAELRWVRPKLVAQIAFTEWTRDGSLRHSKFVALREDKHPKEVVRE